MKKSFSDWTIRSIHDMNHQHCSHHDIIHQFSERRCTDTQPKDNLAPEYFEDQRDEHEVRGTSCENVQRSRGVSSPTLTCNASKQVRCERVVHVLDHPSRTFTVIRRRQNIRLLYVEATEKQISCTFHPSSNCHGRHYHTTHTERDSYEQMLVMFTVHLSLRKKTRLQQR